MALHKSFIHSFVVNKDVLYNVLYSFVVNKDVLYNVLCSFVWPVTPFLSTLQIVLLLTGGGWTDI